MPPILSRVLVVVLGVVVAVTAVYGALVVLPVLPTEWLAGSPFTDFGIPALALGLVVAGLASLSVLAAIMRPGLAGLAAVDAGAALVIFEVVEVAVIGFAWLQVVYLAIGIAQMATGLSLWLATRPDHERLHRTDHRLLGMHP
jgi:hypothetical protein